MKFSPAKPAAALALKLSLVTALLLALSMVLAACSLNRSAVEPKWLVLLTTQELQDSGLIDALLPAYEQANPNVKVKVLPMTSQTAVTYAKLAGIDVVLLPSGSVTPDLGGPALTYPAYQPDPFPTPTAYAGPGPEPGLQPPPALYNERQLALWSELVALAPADDTSALNSPDVASYLKLLVKNNSPFYAPTSGQEPGLAATEERFWGLKAFYTPADRGTGYKQIDTDIFSVVKKVAADKAFTIAPLAVYTALQNDPAVKDKLKIELAGDLALYQPYEVLVPNNTSNTDRDVPLARTLAAYLTNQQAQAQIAKFVPAGAPRAPFRPTYYPVYVP